MKQWPWLFSFFIVIMLLTSLPAVAGGAQEQDLVKARMQLLPSMIPTNHPRVMLHPGELTDFRAYFLAQNNMMWRVVFKSKVLPLKLELALPQEIKAAAHANNAAATAAWQASMAVAADAGNKTQQLALAYLITGDMWYANQAERLLAHLMSWDMRNMTVQANDEAFVQMLHPLLFAYDWIAPVISSQNKEKILAGLELRLNALFNQVRVSLSLTDKPMSVPGSTQGMVSHPVRFVSTLALGGLALYGDTPKAAEILAWAYEYYLGPFTPWGGADGGWSEGPAYWTTAQVQHFAAADAFAALGITDLYNRPWFQNTGYYGLYVVPPYLHASLGDQAAFVTPDATEFYPLRRLAQVYQNPYFARYTEQIGPAWSTTLSYYNPSMMHSIFALYRESKQPVPKGKPLTDLPQSHLFNDIGWVAIHSNMEAPKDDVFFLMKSSPYGGYSHSHADQNSFVLTAFGQPLAISSGYREWYGSNHHNNWTRQTKAKNSILVDGKGQRFAALAPGAAITEFFSGRVFTISTGNAAPAYTADTLTRYDRRVLAVGGNTFVLLDELAAPKESRFDWLLHSRNEMSLAAVNAGLVRIQDGTANLDVRFLYPEAKQLSFQQSNLFTPPVDSAYNLAPQWHLTVSNTTKVKEQRFLTVLTPYRKTAPAPRGAQLVQAPNLLGLQNENLRVLYSLSTDMQPQMGAGLWFQGRLAAVSTATQQTSWILHQGTLLQDGTEVLLKATAAVSAEFTQPAEDVANLYVQCNQANRVEVALKHAPKEVKELKGELSSIPWSFNTATHMLTLDLPAGQWELSVY